MADRLISADDLIEKAYRLRLDGRELIAQMIQSAPTVDAVPVVQCKDCLWGKWNQALWDSIYCEYIGMDRDLNDYCSRGERREDG